MTPPTTTERGLNGELNGAKALDGDLADQMRSAGGSVRVVLELGMKKRVAGAERADALPHGIVQISAAAGGAAVQLRGDKPGLRFEIAGVIQRRA
jgi:hypothetical protein